MNNFIRVRNVYINMDMVEIIKVLKDEIDFIMHDGELTSFCINNDKCSDWEITDEEFKKLKDFIDCMEQNIVVP